MWVPITYGKKIENVKEEDSSLLLTPEGIGYIQQVVGSFLYYVRAIDSTIHLALNDIGSQQSKSTQRTNDDDNILMNCLYTHPNARLRYHKHDMKLYIDSDAAYLVSPEQKLGWQTNII